MAVPCSIGDPPLLTTLQEVRGEGPCRTGARRSSGVVMPLGLSQGAGLFDSYHLTRRG